MEGEKWIQNTKQRRYLVGTPQLPTQALHAGAVMKPASQFHVSCCFIGLINCKTEPWEFKFDSKRATSILF